MVWFTNGLEHIEISFEGKEISRFSGPFVKNVDDVSRWGTFAVSLTDDVVFQQHC